MNKQTARKIGTEIQAILAKEFPEYAVKFKAAGIGEGFTEFKISFSEFRVDGTIATKENGDLRNLLSTYGDQNDNQIKDFLEQTFELYDGNTYRVVGYNTRARKNNWLIERDGKRYKTDTLTLVAAGVFKDFPEKFLKYL